MPDQMQRDALRRVQEMYGGVQQPALQSPAGNREKPSPSPPPQKHDDTKSALPINPVHIDDNKPSKKSDNLLDIIMQDKERSLIILLIIVLVSEKADTTLIMALMYLIL